LGRRGCTQHLQRLDDRCPQPVAIYTVHMMRIGAGFRAPTTINAS
jgi:hypothetical protein